MDIAKPYPFQDEVIEIIKQVENGVRVPVGVLSVTLVEPSPSWLVLSLNLSAREIR